jgi:hypothetical protein
MPERTDGEAAERIKSPWGALTGICGVLWLLTGYQLFSKPYFLLSFNYWAFVLLSFLFFHAFVFFINKWLKVHGVSNRRYLPKLLEYVYAIVLCVGLFQVFIYNQRVTEYINYSSPEEDVLLNQIRARAKRHVLEECGSEQAQDAFCTQVKAIVDAKSQDDLKAKLRTTALRNGSIWTGYNRPAVPELLDLIFLFDAKELHGKASNSTAESSLFWWIGILLLPIAIALRVSKTSLELFADLE